MNQYIQSITQKDKSGSASIFAHEFTVDGVRYRAIPDSHAAKASRYLYSKLSPFKGKKSEYGKGAEATRSGREAIGRLIYYPLDKSRALEYVRKLGTSAESFWSSWFFGRSYAHNKEYRKLSSVGSRLSGYPHVAGMKTRNLIEKDPSKYAGKTEYVMFSFSEAPVDIGDSIIAINRSNPQSFGTFKRNEQQMASHGRIVSKVSGNKVRLHGGNESGTVGMDEIPISGGKFTKLDSQGRLIHPGAPNRYTGILKKVKVLGKDNIASRIKSLSIKSLKLGLYSLVAYKSYTVYKNRNQQ